MVFYDLDRDYIKEPLSETDQEQAFSNLGNILIGLGCPPGYLRPLFSEIRKKITALQQEEATRVARYQSEYGDAGKHEQNQR